MTAAIADTYQLHFITMYIPVQVDNSICIITFVNVIKSVYQRQSVAECSAVDAFSPAANALLQEKTAYSENLLFPEQSKRGVRDLSCGLEDHLGSTRAVVNDQGTVTEATMFYPYGTIVPLLPPSPGDNAREKFTGKELDAGENPVSEVGYTVTIDNFDAGMHYHGELYVNYTDLTSNQSFLKAYEMIYDPSAKKFTLNTQERFPDNMKITHLRIATSGAVSAINYEKDCDYIVNTDEGQTIALNVNGDALISNAGVDYFMPGSKYTPERVAGSNLYYFGARYYDPEVGVWSSPDAERQFWNAYGYTTNPMISVDSDGNWFGIDDAIAAAVGFVVGYVGHGITNGDWGGRAFAMGGVGAAAGLGALYTGGTSLSAFATGGAIAGGGGYSVGAAFGDYSWNAGDFAKSIGFGAMSGVAGGMVGGAVGNGIYGAMAGGFTSGAVGTALNGGDFNDIMLGGLGGGAFAAAAYTSIWAVQNFSSLGSIENAFS